MTGGEPTMDGNEGLFRVTHNPDNIAVLHWDLPGSPVNVFTEATILAFEAEVDRLIADPAVGAVVIASMKPAFHVGADLEMALGMAARPPAELFTRIMRFHALMRRMETAGTTFVAAIAGHALGGGLEMALACHARIVADDSRLQLGLPEAKLGLMPGFGGTQRLARIMPLADALPMLTQGKSVDPRQGRDLGIVTEAVAPDAVIEAACAWARAQPRAVQPWDRRGFKPPSGAVQTSFNVQFFAAAAAQYRKATQALLPAPAAILEAVYQGLQLPIDQALKVEARRFAKVARSPEAAAMIRTLFFGVNHANALKRRPVAAPVRSFRRIGIVGAGLMGSGITYVAARRGLDVIVVDRSDEAAAQARAYSARLLDKALARGRISDDARAEHLARITTTTDMAALADADLVVEAVFETMSVKEKVLRAVEAIVGGDTPIASNTSTIPISQLARCLRRPERLVGLHFFSPVEKMPLLEIISHPGTSASTLAAAFDVCRALGKTPIDVNDGRGFFTTRVVSAYMAEGMAMLAEGVPPALIDNAGRQAGMPMGPLRLADMVNLDLAVQIADQTAADLGAAYSEHPGLAAARRMVSLGRSGEKSSRGFYDHDGQTATLWPALAATFPARDVLDVDAVRERLILVQALETLRCFDDGVLKTPQDADLGSVLGWGFPPHTGGVASYIDEIGAAELLTSAERLAAAHGPRFAPPHCLQRLARAGGRLHETALADLTGAPLPVR